jgi:hypothetical protein
MSYTTLGVEDILTGEIKEMAEYYLPSDILHMRLVGDYKNLSVSEMPSISATLMSKLFNKPILSIYLEIE